jgi:hypothetical protein
MPDKPLWLARLPHVVEELESAADQWVDRARLEALLGIGRRRAQQLLSKIPSRQVGASRIAISRDVAAYLRSMAAGEQALYDSRRRKHLWEHLGQERERWMDQPPVLVEVQKETLRRITHHDLTGLPEGVALTPGAIHLSFTTPEEALEQLVALAVAISRNREAFDHLVSLEK